MMRATLRCYTNVGVFAVHNEDMMCASSSFPRRPSLKDPSLSVPDLHEMSSLLSMALVQRPGDKCSHTCRTRSISWLCPCWLAAHMPGCVRHPTPAVYGRIK